MKVVAVTWSFEDTFDIERTTLYRSFIKNNKKEDIVNIHYNREDYKKEEEDFKGRFGNQYEFLLYRIYLLKDRLKDIEEQTLIFSDTNDVVCLGDIKNISHSGGIKFSAEKHQYPNNIDSWKLREEEQVKYSKEGEYLNAGLQIAKKSEYIKLIENVIENIIPLDYKDLEETKEYIRTITSASYLQ